MPKFMNVHSRYMCHICEEKIIVIIYGRKINQLGTLHRFNPVSTIGSAARARRREPPVRASPLPLASPAPAPAPNPGSRSFELRSAACGVRISTSSRAALLVPPRHPLPPRHARPLTRCRGHLLSDHGTPGSLPRMWLGGWVAGSSSSRRPCRG